jgi:hypothetical protein
MAVMNVFMTTTTAESPLDASTGTEAKPPVSDFITVQSFTNFAAMTGSLLISKDGLKKTKDGRETWELGTLAGAVFVALINSLVLAGAVVGTNIATGQTH